MHFAISPCSDITALDLRLIPLALTAGFTVDHVTSVGPDEHLLVERTKIGVEGNIEHFDLERGCQ